MDSVLQAGARQVSWPASSSRAARSSWSATDCIRAAATRVDVGELGAAGRDDPGERGGPQEYVGEVAAGDARAAPGRPWPAARRGRAGRPPRSRPGRPRRGRDRRRTRRATPAGSAYTQERRRYSRHRQPAIVSAGRPAQASAIVSIPSVSARWSTRSATSLSPESWAPRDQQAGGPVGRLGQPSRVVTARDALEEPVARRERSVVRALGHRTTVASVGQGTHANRRVGCADQRLVRRLDSHRADVAPRARTVGPGSATRVPGRRRSPFLVGIEKVAELRCGRNAKKNSRLTAVERHG